ncbi:unnamed protein product, partial [Vitis vinifera]
MALGRESGPLFLFLCLIVFSFCSLVFDGTGGSTFTLVFSTSTTSASAASVGSSLVAVADEAAFFFAFFSLSSSFQPLSELLWLPWLQICLPASSSFPRPT